MPTRVKHIWYENVDSTNKEARRLLEAGELSDTLSLIAAKSQTSGRGQGDHKWTSAPGMNLTFTLVIRDCSIPVSRQQLINDIVCPVICSLLEEEGVKAWVKAPNDIWVADRKICGILVENILRGTDIATCFIGIGLNLNQKNWPEDLPNPVSLSELTGKAYVPEDVLLRLEKKFLEVLG